MDSACDITACTSHGRCDVAPRWCRAWRYIHKYDSSNANAAFVREKIPSGYLSFDARGNVCVSQEVYGA